MSHRNTIKAWKNPEYRMSLTEEERAGLPSNPAGLIELTDAELDDIAGGAPPINPRPRTPLCPTVPKKSIERGNCPTFLCSGFFCR